MLQKEKQKAVASYSADGIQAVKMEVTFTHLLPSNGLCGVHIIKHINYIKLAM